LLDWFWLALATKLGASALIVVAASIIVERSGPFIGAMVATLPISAGPAYVVLALEHGPDFIAKSSLSSLSINAATILFLSLYALLARRHGLLASLAASFALWIACAVAIIWMDAPLIGVVAMNVAAFAIGFTALRGLARAGAVARRPQPRWWDLPSRALAVMGIVVLVLVVGHLFGPRAAGIAALMPVVLTSLALILHPRIGGEATSLVFAHALPGMVGFTLALLVLQVSVIPLGSALALLLALGTCLVWNAMLVLRRRSTTAARTRR
jgi:hypothetical protein